MISLLPFLTYHPLPHLLKILASNTPLLSTETQHSHDNPSEPLASQFLTSLLPPQPPIAHRHALHLVTTSNNTNFKIVIPKSLEARRSRNRESRPSIVFSHLEQRSSPESGTYCSTSLPNSPLSHLASGLSFQQAEPVCTSEVCSICEFSTLL